MVPTPRKMSDFVFLYYFDVNVQKAEASSLVLAFPTECQPHLRSALGLTFLATVWPSFPFPKKDQCALGPVITPCWDVGPQEGESSVSHSAKEYAKYSNRHHLLLSFSTLIC